MNSVYRATVLGISGCRRQLKNGRPLCDAVVTACFTPPALHPARNHGGKQAQNAARMDTSHLSLERHTRRPSRGQGFSGGCSLHPGSPGSGDREETVAQRHSCALGVTTWVEMLLPACEPIHSPKDTIAGPEGRPRCPRRTCSRAQARVRSMVGPSRLSRCAWTLFNSSQGPASWQRVEQGPRAGHSATSHLPRRAGGWGAGDEGDNRSCLEVHTPGPCVFVLICKNPPCSTET